MAYSGKKGSELRQNVEKPTRAGYIFEGWYTSKKFTAASEVYDPYHYNVTKKATVYAKWIKAVTITYKAGKGYFYDGSGNKVATVKRTYAKGYSANTRFSDYYDHQLVGAGSGAEYYDGSNYPYPYYNEKYYFAGWYTDAKLTKAYDFSKKLTKSITLYAKYAKISSSTQVTLTIDPNGGKINNHYSNKVSVAKNTPIYDLNPNTVVPPKGKVLFGFTTKKNNPNTLIESGKVFKKNATVYAYYSTEYTIVLNANGGFSNSGSYYNGSVYDVFNTKTVKVTKGHPVGYVDYYYDNLSSDHMLTNAKGLIFRGWYSDKACKKLVTYDLYSFYPTKNMVLYAKWGKPNKAGWQQSNGKWWYKLANGDYYKNTFHSVDNKLYYFDASGYICKGWKQVGERWYYLASSGAVTFGWKKISGNWYYFREDGSMATGSLKIGKKTYKFNKSGVCLNP